MYLKLQILELRLALKLLFKTEFDFRASTKKNGHRVFKNRKTQKHFIGNSSKSKMDQRKIAMQCLQEFSGEKSKNPIRFVAKCFFKIPKSGKNKDKISGDACMLMPDSSNILNLLHDAVEGIVYENDSQITYSICEKVWDEEDRVLIEIYEV